MKGIDRGASPGLASAAPSASSGQTDGPRKILGGSVTLPVSV